jgi:radical SAM protein with 4Fe4S-binding SPASM domain
MLNFYFAVNRHCNLRCRYCYLPIEQRNDDEPAEEQAEAALGDLLAKMDEEGMEIGHVHLHGAEPGLLAPEILGRMAAAIHRRSGRLVAIQTNGTMIDGSWLDRLESALPARGILKIGITVDGPKAIHDAVRHRSFDRAWAALTELNRRGYQTYVLSCVGAHTAQRLDDYAAWVEELVGQRQFLFFQLLAGDCAMSADHQERFADWLYETGNLWRCLGFQAGLCSLSGNSCSWLELGADSKAYSCNKGYSTSLAFADWRETTLADMIPERLDLYADHPLDPACPECRAWDVCHGGCPLERSQGKALDCALRLRIFDRMTADGQDLAAFIAANRHIGAAYYARDRSLEAISRRFNANRTSPETL